MDGIAFQPESHQDGFDTQYPFEITDNGNTPSTSYRQRLFTECLGKSFFGSLISWMRDRAYITLAAMHRSDFDLYVVGGDGMDVVGK